MQREKERADGESLKRIQPGPCLVLVAFYVSIYAYTARRAYLRQGGTLLDGVECNATLQGTCTFYELSPSPIGLPLHVANFSRLAIDYVQVGAVSNLSYTFNRSDGRVHVWDRETAWSERHAPLGDYQTYVRAGTWDDLEEADSPSEFPERFHGRRLRTEEWSLEPMAATTDRFFEFIGQLKSIVPLFIGVVLPPAIARSCGRTFIVWYVAFGLFMCFGGHGLAGGSVVFCFATVNFLLAKLCAKLRVAMVVCWAFNLPLMLLAFKFVGPLDYWENFCGGGAQQQLRFEGSCTDLHRWMQHTVDTWPALTGFVGLAPWHSFRFVTLRMIAFFIDYHHTAVGNPPAIRLEGKPDLMIRQERNLDIQDYTFYHYIAYVFYPPLYWGGPIIGFNAFISQLYDPQHTYSAIEIAKYCLRIALTAVSLTVCLHFNYASALLFRGVPGPVRENIGTWEMFGMLHWMLQYQWLSLLVIWRTSRAVALLDGIDTPENMLLCVDGNYRFEHFWRIWHASLNRWALRYIYLPMGGKTSGIAVYLIFAFVALWHETTGPGTEPFWYLWAFLNALGVTIEKMMVSSKMALPPRLRSVAWGANIFALMLANAPVLFFGATPEILRALVWSQGWRSLLLIPVMWVIFTCTVVVIDAIRDPDRRAPKPERKITEAEVEVRSVQSHRSRVRNPGSIQHSSFCVEDLENADEPPAVRTSAGRPDDRNMDDLEMSGLDAMRGSPSVHAGVELPAISS